MIAETKTARLSSAGSNSGGSLAREQPQGDEYWHSVPADRFRWTRQAVDIMEQAGQLSGRYELLDGELIRKMGQNAPHSICVMRAILYLAGTRAFEPDCIRSQASMEVQDEDRVSNRPEPDVMVLREPTRHGVPAGDNVLLAIEVSDTTQRDDFGVKTTLYARAGVQEYWILDLQRRQLTQFRNPQGNGWEISLVREENDAIAPLSAEGHEVRVADLLPPLDFEKIN